MKLLLSLFMVCLLATSVLGDCYMHNPRGSNNRLNEENTNRNNANRLCDTQNNGKGGYCWGPPMTFYEGSYLVVEWTAQHGCGNPRLECNIVIQYLCTSEDDGETTRVRDGTTTDTIPDDPSASQEKDGNGDFIYGMHETYEYYQMCKTRNRNLGLFIADREEEGGLSEGRRAAIFTRQNNGGNRHGFECAEERDYYPYWHWAPWRDMAVLVEDESYCSFYKEYSQNVKERNHCEDSAGTYLPASTEVECSSVSGTWVTDEAWGIDAPDCVKAGFSRENHLGNGLEAYAETYNGTIPTTEDACGHAEQCECVLRIRYNISTGDLDNSPYGSFTDYTSNLAASPVHQDPIVEQEDKGFKLAIDTSQFFRTFEDRSHIFYITNRPDGIPSSARIYNLNVRGKRGNIVQCYPAVEYDFVPEVLRPKVGDFIHFQWTGCDTNPNGNAGEGRASTDRSNIVQIMDINAAYPATDDDLANNPLFESEDLRQRMAYLGQKDCPTYEELLADNGGDENAVEQDERNCFLLNAAPAYFNGGAVKMNNTGTFYYMSTRNNNFSNRGQKAVIEVVNVLPTWAIALVVIGGVIFLGAVGLSGAMFYAKSHPHSGVAAALNKF